jgi:hypothetical protein
MEGALRLRRNLFRRELFTEIRAIDARDCTALRTEYLEDEFAIRACERGGVLDP